MRWAEKWNGREMCIDLVVEEDKDFKAGDAKPMRIKKATIPQNTLLLISPHGRQGVGQVISISEEITMPVEFDRSADHALLFQGSLDLSRKMISCEYDVSSRSLKWGEDIDQLANSWTFKCQRI